MALEIPADAATERALWQQLTAEMVEQIFPVPGVHTAPDGAVHRREGQDAPIQAVSLATGGGGLIERSLPRLLIG